jgi:hypothetical protein
MQELCAMAYTSLAHGSHNEIFEKIERTRGGEGDLKD